jgi:hypothetical protein
MVGRLRISITLTYNTFHNTAEHKRTNIPQEGAKNCLGKYEAKSTPAPVLGAKVYKGNTRTDPLIVSHGILVRRVVSFMSQLPPPPPAPQHQYALNRRLEVFEKRTKSLALAENLTL